METDARIIELSHWHKRATATATGTQFQCPVRVKTPCIARPAAWFTTHRVALMAAANESYITHYANKTLMPAFFSLPEDVRDILFDRVVDEYVALAATGGLVMTLRHGCCDMFHTCSMALYMRHVLVVLRAKIREEEDTWPRDL